jgi:hypothetical protein
LLREIIREEDQNTRVTPLEYLKQLHPVEWENFVKDILILAEESAMFNGGVNPFANDEKGQTKADNLPFLFHWFQECCTGIYPSHTYLGFSSRADSIQDRIWNDELLEGDQTDVPRRKPRGCPTSWWKYG